MVYRGAGCGLVVVCCDDDGIVDENVDDSDGCTAAVVCAVVAVVAADVDVDVVELLLLHDDGCPWTMGCCSRVCCVNDK
jgi:hypothetical protein